MLLVVLDPRISDHLWSRLNDTFRDHVVSPNAYWPEESLLVEMAPTTSVNFESFGRKVNWRNSIEIELVPDSTAKSDPFTFHLGVVPSQVTRCLIIIAGEIDTSAIQMQLRNLEQRLSDIIILNAAEEQEPSRIISRLSPKVYLSDPSSIDETINEVERWLRVGDPISETKSNSSKVDYVPGDEVTPIVFTTEESPSAKSDPSPRTSVPLRRQEPKSEESQFEKPQPSEQTIDSHNGMKENPKMRTDAGKRNRGRRSRFPLFPLLSKGSREAELRVSREIAGPDPSDRHGDSGGISIVDGQPRRSRNGNIIVQAHSSLNHRPWHSENWMKLADSGPGRDLEIEYGGAQNLRIMAGSARGTRHQYYGEPNQDAFAVAQNEQFVILVVSDGVGAAKHAAYGSTFMSHVTAKELRFLLDSQPTTEVTGIRRAIQGALQKASDSVQSWTPGSLYAPNDNQDLVARRDLSATITVCVIPIVASDSDIRRVVCGYVGDSPCYTLGELGWTLRSKPTKDGEILDLATAALPIDVRDQLMPDFVEFDLGIEDSLFLMTDGIGTSLGSGRTPVGRWLATRLRNPILASDFLSVVQAGDWVDTLTFDRQGEDDDRTLIMLYDYVGVNERIKREAEDSGLPEDPGTE